MFVATAPAARASLLVISPETEDRDQLQFMLPTGHWEIAYASDWKLAYQLLNKHAFSVIVADLESAEMDWKDLIGSLERTCPERTPRLVVASSAADDTLWSEVLNLGGYNVLAKPYDPREVCWVLHHAHADWEQAPAVAASAC